MERIIAKLVNGPLNGALVSVSVDQAEIGGLDFAGYEPMQVELDEETGEPRYVDKYIKDESTVREFVGEEEGLAVAAFDHDVNAICEFHYEVS